MGDAVADVPAASLMYSEGLRECISKGCFRMYVIGKIQMLV